MKTLLMLLLLVSLISCRPDQESADFSEKDPAALVDDFLEVVDHESIDKPTEDLQIVEDDDSSSDDDIVPVSEDLLDNNDMVGLRGGHFDFDTATELYGENDGDVNHHVHEYDNRYYTSRLNFFNLMSGKFDEIDDAVGNRSFYLNIVNSHKSLGGRLYVNGNQIKVKDFEDSLASLRSGGSATKYSIFQKDDTLILSSLSLGFDSLSIMNGHLVGTTPGCVKQNLPSSDGEYRNGALVVQAIDADLPFEFDPETGAPKLGSALLWEGIVYWHWDNGCQ